MRRPKFCLCGRGADGRARRTVGRSVLQSLRTRAQKCVIIVFSHSKVIPLPHTLVRRRSAPAPPSLTRSSRVCASCPWYTACSHIRHAFSSPMGVQRRLGLCGTSLPWSSGCAFVAMVQWLASRLAFLWTVLSNLFLWHELATSSLLRGTIAGRWLKAGGRPIKRPKRWSNTRVTKEE